MSREEYVRDRAKFLATSAVDYRLKKKTELPIITFWHKKGIKDFSYKFQIEAMDFLV